MTDDELATFCGLAADDPIRDKFIKTISPEKRALFERMANLEIELKLWQDGLGPKPTGVLIDSCIRERERVLKMTNEERATEFCQGAFGPFGVELGPYIKLITELLDGATEEAATSAYQNVGTALLKVSGDYPPEIGQLIGELGNRLVSVTREGLIQDGLIVLAEEVIAERNHA